MSSVSLCVLTILLFIGTSLLVQTDYKVILERLEVNYTNDVYLKNVTVKMFFATRTEKRMNASGILLQDMESEIQTIVEAYKFQSNEYRAFPFLYKMDACNAWQSNLFGMNYGSYDTNVTMCPVRKGYYYAANVKMNDKEYPPFAPRGRFKITIKIYLRKTILISSVDGFIEIKPSNPLERVIM